MDYEPRRLTRRRRNEHWGVEPDPELEDQLEDVTGAYDVVNRRRILWRDSAFILIGVVVALLLAQIMLPRDGGTGADDPTDFMTGAALGLTSAPRTPAPGDTFGPIGPILDPSLGIDATPPVITLGPTRRPTPIPSAAPGATPAPTPRITPRPSPTPPPPPTAPPTAVPTPEITPPPPPPAAGFSWAQILPLTVEFTNASAGETSWSWDFGDGGTSSEQNPTHVYLEARDDYVVRLTVTGPGGTDFIEKTVTVTAI